MGGSGYQWCEWVAQTTVQHHDQQLFNGKHVHTAVPAHVHRNPQVFME